MTGRELQEDTPGPTVVAGGKGGVISFYRAAEVEEEPRLCAKAHKRWVSEIQLVTAAADRGILRRFPAVCPSLDGQPTKGLLPPRHLTNSVAPRLPPASQCCR